MKRLTIAFIVSLLAIVAAMAQAPAPVRWRIAVQMDSPTEGTVTVRALIGAGWHLYGTELPQNGPRPTVIDFGNSKGIALTGSLKPSREPVSKRDDMFGMTVTFWDKDVAFTQKFRVTDAADASVQAVVTYMACDDTNCMPPKKVTLTAPVRQPSK